VDPWDPDPDSDPKHCPLSLRREKMLKSDGAGGQAGVERLIDAKIGDEAVQAGGKGGNIRLLAEGGGQDGPLVGVQLLLGGQEGGQEAGEEAGKVRGRHVVDGQADLLAQQVVRFGHQHLNEKRWRHC
jgi:hypothetical protein